MFGCGSNASSQLGFPSSKLKDSLIPIRIPFTKSSQSSTSKSDDVIVSIDKIAAGGACSFCADAHGNIYAFGSNLFSILGFGGDFKTVNGIVSRPTLHPFFNQTNHNRRILHMESTSSTGVIDADGSLFLFGRNTHGQIGNGESKGQRSYVADPFQIEIADRKWKQVSVAFGHTLMLTRDETNEVYACGAGQIRGVDIGNVCFQQSGAKCLSLVLCERGTLKRAISVLQIAPQILAPSTKSMDTEITLLNVPRSCTREMMGIADTETHAFGRVVRVIAMHRSSVIVAEQLKKNKI